MSTYICPMLFGLPFVFPFSAGPSVNLWQLLASWLCVVLLALMGPVARPHRVILAWLVTTAIAIILRSSPELGAVPSLAACTAVAVSGIAAGIGAGLMRENVKALRALALGLLIAGLISTALGLLQYYGLAEAFAPWTTEPGIGQAYGNLRQRNQLATLLNMALVAALWLHADRGGWRRRLLMGASCVLVIGLAASTSRTGMLQLLVIVGLAAFIGRRERRGAVAAAGDLAFRLPSPLALLALIPLYFAASWLLPFLVGGEVEGMLERLRDGAPAGHSRLILWRNVLALIAQHPWAGWGWGELSYAHYSTLYHGPRFVEILDNAHNLPLHLAAELGIPAALLICGSFFWMVIGARPWAERAPSRLMAWGLLGVVMLHSLLEYPLWYGPFQMVFGVCLGMLWPHTHRIKGALRSPAREHGFATPVGRRLLTFAAAALLGCLGYAAWDYTRISQIYLPRSERVSRYEDDTLAKLQGSWLFANQVRFAELTLTPVTGANAQRMYEMAGTSLHFSPEPRVIVKRIESAKLSGRLDEARAEIERFRIAFPLDFDLWLKGQPLTSPAP